MERGCREGCGEVKVESERGFERESLFREEGFQFLDFHLLHQWPLELKLDLGEDEGIRDIRI